MPHYFRRFPRFDEVLFNAVLSDCDETVRTRDANELTTRVLTCAGDFGASQVGAQEAGRRMIAIGRHLEANGNLKNDSLVLAVKGTVHYADFIRINQQRERLKGK